MSAWPIDIASNWFVATQSALLADKPLTVTLLDMPVVIARLRDGSVAALEDRCAHRHVPLSAGKVTDDGIECPYHGWTFGSEGHCTKIPGLAVPQACEFRVPRYPVTEHDGLIWIYLDAAKQPPPLPTLAARSQPACRRFLWQTVWHAPIVDCIENFLDAMHTHYVHAGLVRREATRRKVTANLAFNEEGFAVDYRGQETQSGLIYRLFESNRTGERALFAKPGVAQLEYTYRDGSIARITLYFSPQDEWHTRVFTSFHIEGRWAPAWAVRLFLWPFLHRVATQDVYMLKLQSQNRMRFANGRFASTRNDFLRTYLESCWMRDAPAVIDPQARAIELLI